jgi:Tfp pilus assembly PilM family ATPase/Tfp pilus assembly protein PilN
MPRLLALEWNEIEARVVVACGRPAHVTIEHAFVVSLRPNQPGAEPSASDVIARLAAALAARGLGRLDSLVAVGRNNVELRQFSIPPAPDDELPDMVRFQALREFNAMDENWRLDFVPIDEDPQQPRTVLAAAISPDQVAQIQTTCQGIGLKPKRLILRSCAAVSLYCHRQADARPRVRLLVDLFEEEADLTVMVDRKVIFLRSARLTGDPFGNEDASRALVSEFRRTMAAVQNQLGGRKVEAMVLCGRAEKVGALADTISQRLDLPVEVFDPFEGLSCGGELRQAMPEFPGRFTPLLGMLLDELNQNAPALDFFHPRRRPEPKKHHVRYGLIGLAVALVLGLWAGYEWWQCGSLDAQIDDLRQEAASWDKQIESLKAIDKAALAVQNWQGANASALEELEWLSTSLPPSQDVMLTKLQLTQHPLNASATFTGYAKSSDAMKAMDKNLSQPPHQLSGKSNVAQAAEKSYSFQFNKSVLLPREQSK